MSSSASRRVPDPRTHPASAFGRDLWAFERRGARLPGLYETCGVALLLLLVLTGCGGPTWSLRSGTGPHTLRDSGPYGNLPTQGFSGGSAGQELPRSAPRLVPQDVTTTAEAGTATAAGEALVAGGSVVAAGGSVVLVCLTVKAASNGMPTPVDIADTFYGTHFGDVQGWVQGCYAPKAQFSPGAPKLAPGAKPESEPRALPHPAQGPEAHENGDKRTWGRVYATYTKFNSRTGRYYSGRTSMVIDLSKPLRAQAAEAVLVRDSNHHTDENDESKSPRFEAAQIDRFDVGIAADYENRYTDFAYWRIRGREQQLIDSFGGAQSDTRKPYLTENIQRGVAKGNPLGKLFHDAATEQWGQLHPYTGD